MSMDILQLINTAPEQIGVFLLLIAAIIMFMWGKWRYDVVAMVALLATIFAGYLSPQEAFFGFVHPAVVIVASMFVLGRGLVESGIIEVALRRLSSNYIQKHPVLQLLLLSVLVAVASAFVNNVGALAFIMPIAIKMARKSDVSPAMFLMPLAFASHMGGFLTLIGSPRNIIISTFREEAVGSAFRMFDFAYVGIGVTLIGILFISIIGWRLIPRREDESESEELFEVNNYITEVEVTEGSPVVGQPIREIKNSVDGEVIITTLIRGEHHIYAPSNNKLLKPGDILLIQDNPEALTELVEVNNLALVGNKAVESRSSQTDEMKDIEAVVSPSSILTGRRWKEISLHMRYGVNLLAIAREGSQLTDHLDDIRFRSGDILLLRGRAETLEDEIQRLGCLPLAEREITFGRSPRKYATLAIFATTVILASVNLFPVHIIFLTGALLMVLLEIVSLPDAYESIDWSVIMLVGAMIAFGDALEGTGAIMQISNGIISLSEVITPTMVLVLVLVASMLLSDFVNSTASAVLMAPVAIQVGQSLGASIDPFLMAVAIGASAAFLTPIAHESNTLVMSPGGYKFRDFWRMGLPLEILIAVTSIPLILYFWPLF